MLRNAMSPELHSARRRRNRGGVSSAWRSRFRMVQEKEIVSYFDLRKVQSSITNKGNRGDEGVKRNKGKNSPYLQKPTGTGYKQGGGLGRKRGERLSYKYKRGKRRRPKGGKAGVGVWEQTGGEQKKRFC